MTRNSLLLAAALLAVFAVGALWGQYGLMSRAQAQDDAQPPGLKELAGIPGNANPAVACTPLAYTTDNEEDPFNPDRVRRTRTRVQSIVVVYADGTVKTEKVPGG